MWLICTLLIISIRMIQVGLKYNEARKARLAAAKISSDEKTQRELAAALILQKVARRRAVEERKGTFAAHLGAENYAVGVKCALEKISASLRVLAA